MTTRPHGSAFQCKENFNFTSLLDCGAVLDGVTDNTAAVTLAQSYGLPVYVPPGTCLCGAFTATVPFFGLDRQSILKCKAAALGPFITLSSGVQLKDLVIDGNKANQVGATNHGLYLNNVSKVRLDNILVQNTLGDCINITGGSFDISAGPLYLTGFTKNGLTIENATDCLFDKIWAYNSDLAATTGDGVALAPTALGNVVSDIVFGKIYSKSNIGRGFAALGFGSKNVKNILVNGIVTDANTGHGVHIFTAQGITVTGICKNNGGDGFRLEGDTQYCRVNSSVADTNTGYGMREVTTGSTPNYNYFIAGTCLNNVASNVITKVGANSQIL